VLAQPRKTGLSKYSPLWLGKCGKGLSWPQEAPVPHLDERIAAIPAPADLGGAGLRAFFNIARAWKLSEAQQLRLLGLTVRSTLFAWKRKAAQGPVKLGPDTLERLGNLVGIWKALAILFPQDEIADRWVHQPNDNYPFLGESPLTTMQGSMEGLAQARRRPPEGGWRVGACCSHAFRVKSLLSSRNALLLVEVPTLDLKRRGGYSSRLPSQQYEQVGREIAYPFRRFVFHIRCLSTLDIF